MKDLVKVVNFVDYRELMELIGDKIYSIESVNKDTLFEHFFNKSFNGMIEKYDVGQYREDEPIFEDGEINEYANQTRYEIHKIVRDYFVNECGLTDEDTVILHYWW